MRISDLASFVFLAACIIYLIYEMIRKRKEEIEEAERQERKQEEREQLNRMQEEKQRAERLKMEQELAKKKLEEDKLAKHTSKIIKAARTINELRYKDKNGRLDILIGEQDFGDWYYYDIRSCIKIHVDGECVFEKDYDNILQRYRPGNWEKLLFDSLEKALEIKRKQDEEKQREAEKIAEQLREERKARETYEAKAFEPFDIDLD